VDGPLTQYLCFALSPLLLLVQTKCGLRQALFGDVETHATSVLPQAESYVHRFGPGMVLYWFGHAPLSRLGDAKGDVVIWGWDLPETFLWPTGEIGTRQLPRTPHERQPEQVVPLPLDIPESQSKCAPHTNMSSCESVPKIDLESNRSSDLEESPLIPLSLKRDSAAFVATATCPRATSNTLSEQ
jgi:Protein of unknown function TPD sequence-motif